jgi:uncharacterized membrane protein YoaK (UPF0700 family)
MIHKLDNWAWLGGAALAGIAGMVNAIGYPSYSHQAVTHLTGTASQLGITLSDQSYAAAGHLALVILAFLGGAILSGFIIQRQTLKLGRRHGVALGIEGMLLVVAALLMRRHHEAGSYFASAAFGLQNAMATTYSGAILRTTHVTGIVTDLGATLGHALRGLDVHGARVRPYLLVLGAFVTGGVIGGVFFRFVGTDALFYPAALTLVVAFVYSAYAHRKKRGIARPCCSFALVATGLLIAACADSAARAFKNRR